MGFKISQPQLPAPNKWLSGGLAADYRSHRTPELGDHINKQCLCFLNEGKRTELRRLTINLEALPGLAPRIPDAWSRESHLPAPLHHIRPP